MATVKRANYAAQGYSASTLKTFFDSLNCPIITTSLASNVLTINVNNIVNVVFDFSASRTKTVYNGTTKEYSIINTYNSATITAVCNENVFYVQFNGNYGSGRRFCFLYENISNEDYWGAVGAGTDSSSGHAWYSITDITLSQTETSLTYNHGTRLNYACELGYIDYAPDVLFISGYKSIDDPNFITCSTVPTDQVITFQGQNYYSIGAHTLCLIDD